MPLRRQHILIRLSSPRTCFTVDIINDLAVEGDETFTLTLAASGIGVNVTSNGTVVKIIDDDGKVVNFIPPKLNIVIGTELQNTLSENFEAQLFLR